LQRKNTALRDCRSAFSKVGELSDIDVLVTGRKDGSEEVIALRELGATVIEVDG
jgi:DeoR/GlpR family transcriptional regulator of sugar metabolism